MNWKASNAKRIKKGVYPSLWSCHLRLCAPELRKHQFIISRSQVYSHRKLTGNPNFHTEIFYQESLQGKGQWTNNGEGRCECMMRNFSTTGQESGTRTRHTITVGTWICPSPTVLLKACVVNRLGMLWPYLNSSLTGLYLLPNHFNFINFIFI